MATKPPVTAPDLLEREEQLDALERHLVEAPRQGRVVLVSGEAGIGKSALVRRFCEGRPFLWGACDALFTPRPLGPLVDIAAQSGGELEERLEQGAAPHEVADALLGELQRRTGVIVVVEDLHWADEATLDVIRLAIRKLEPARALLLATFRDDELGPTHPLRIVLGETATGPTVHRLRLQPLSLEAVGELAEPHGVDAAALHARTGGNPFFVTEVLAEPEAELPASIRDAVLARAARLTAPARRLLDAVAIVPQAVEPWLLEAIAAEDASALGECLASGMLREEGGGIVFRHELARSGIEEAAETTRRTALHRRALDGLRRRDADPARIAHHAEMAGDAAAVLEFAPIAAEQAQHRHARREAAAQYARALRFADGLELKRRARLWEDLADELQITDAAADALAARNRALAAFEELGDARKVGVQLQAISALERRLGRAREAEHAARRSTEVLEALPAGPELAHAYAHLAYLSMLADDVASTQAWGTKALDVAERVGRRDIAADALLTMGAAATYTGRPEGLAQMERGLELSRAADADIGRPLGVLVAATVWVRRFDLADRYLQEGLAFTGERELDAWRNWMVGWRGLLDLHRGRWNEAAEGASRLLRTPRLPDDRRLFAVLVLGRVRSRRGDPEKWELLDEAKRLADASPQVQRLTLVGISRAETAWLEHNLQGAAEATQPAYSLALDIGDPWAIGELALWRRRAGLKEDVPAEIAEPFALELGGKWQRAAERWTELECPYDAALALASSGQESALRKSLAELQRLGARPAAAIVARRLRKRGVRGLQRGPRPTTRANPAGLTRREVEVLVLLAEGLANTAIAEKLFLSPKTVGHHVSSILRKLGVRTRAEASAEAVRLGLANLPR